MKDLAEKIEGARTVLGILIERGEDLSLPRHVMYFFYGQELAAIENDLRSMGFEFHNDESYWGVVERHRSLEEQGYEIDDLKNTNCLVAERTEIVDESWLEGVYTEFCLLADKHKVDFDGWQASCENDADGPHERLTDAQTR